MYFKIKAFQENELLKLPETGMGYQIVEARKEGNYTREQFLVLNSEVVIEMNKFTTDNVRMIINEGVDSIKTKANFIVLNAISVLNESQYRSVVKEPKNEKERGAIENPVEQAYGEELLVQLSAFDNDRRVDKKNKCLLPGSFTTTLHDASYCKFTNKDPVEYYALPNDDKVKFAFHIKPVKTDTLQRGTVQPANDKLGGGKECYFANGTSNGTFLKQTPYY